MLIFILSCIFSFGKCTKTEGWSERITVTTKQFATSVSTMTAKDFCPPAMIGTSNFGTQKRERASTDSPVEKYPTASSSTLNRTSNISLWLGRAIKRLFAYDHLQLTIATICNEKERLMDDFMLQWDTRSGEIIQEYDRHLGAVNTITFVDGNRRFVTTSDDKSLRVWEW